jgi:tetratricopeptide (TPR) repeat protein
MKNAIFRLVSVSFLTMYLFSLSAHAQQAQCGETDYDCQIRLYRGQILGASIDPEAYYSLAAALQNKGDYAASIGFLDLYVASAGVKAEYLADGYNKRGYARKRLDQQTLAIEDFSKAIGLFPKAFFYFNRGSSYASLKQYALAVTDQTKAISLDKNFSSAYFARGFAYMEQKTYPAAIADFTQVIALDPAESEAFYNRGTIYYRQKSYALAVADLDKYIALNNADEKNLADGYENRGLAHFFLGNTQKAIDDFTKAIQLAPAMKNAYLNRADAYRKLGKIDLAEADEKKAATL